MVNRSTAQHPSLGAEKNKWFDCAFSLSSNSTENESRPGFAQGTDNNKRSVPTH